MQAMTRGRLVTFAIWLLVPTAISTATLLPFRHYSLDLDVAARSVCGVICLAWLAVALPVSIRNLLKLGRYSGSQTVHFGRQSVIKLLCLLVAVLNCFAYLLYVTGIKDAVSPAHRLRYVDALYFSVTTWTTVGFGDIVPIGFGRLVASMEALIGYFFMLGCTYLLVLSTRNVPLR